MNKNHIIIIKIFIMFAAFPLLMGNQNCQIDKKLLEIFNQKISPPSNQSSIYITHLSFMDPTSGGSLIQTEAGKLINDAVINGINLAKKTNNSIKHNEPGHLIKDTDGKVNELVNITFDPNLTRNEKITKIINDMMKPANVDVIVTGQYIDKGQTIDVRPLTIVRHEQKIVTKIATFSKENFICKDPNNPNVKTLCTDAHDQISELVKELLLAL